MNLDLNFSLMVPELLVVLAALAILVVDAVTDRTQDGGTVQEPTGVVTWMAVAGTLAAALWIVAVQWQPGASQTGFGGLFVVDSFALAFKVVILLGAAVSLLISDAWLAHQRMPRSASYALVLFATSGMMYMVSAGDFVMLFLGLEVMSIPIYCLAGAQRWDTRSTEAAVKYLVLGSFGTALLLFGMAMLYAWTGLHGVATTQLAPLSAALLRSPEAIDGYAVGGGLLLLTGLLFKISAAPFHMWTPDVYEGAPTGTTAFMSVAVKATAAAALLRVFGGGVLEALHLDGLLWGVAALTMIVGNVVALGQANVKRMLAYSSVAHGGYILVGVLAGGPQAEAGILYYTLAYTLANLAAFGSLVYLSREGRAIETFDDLAGLGTRHPLIGGVMSLAMLSLIGIPPLAGFFGKFMLFRAAIEAGFIGLSVLALLTSAVSVAYYLRPMIAMFMKEPAGAATTPAPGNGRLALALGFVAIAVVAIGALPDGSLAWATGSTLAAQP